MTNQDNSLDNLGKKMKKNGYHTLNIVSHTESVAITMLD